MGIGCIPGDTAFPVSDMLVGDCTVCSKPAKCWTYGGAPFGRSAGAIPALGCVAQSTIPAGCFINYWGAYPYANAPYIYSGSAVDIPGTFNLCIAGRPQLFVYVI